MLAHRHTFLRMDTDTPAPQRGLTAYVDALGLRVTPEGVWVADGAAPIPCALPAGGNTCIGTVLDEATGRLLWFNANGSGQDGIWAYDAEAGTTTELLRWTGFQFPVNGLVQAAVQGRTLLWVDGVNPARQLDLDDVATVAAAPSEEAFALARRPPLLPLTVEAFYDAVPTNRLVDASLQFTYRYRYRNEQFSVLAPWSVLLPMRQWAGPPYATDVYVDTAVLTVPVQERPGALVVATEFYVRKGNTGAVYRLLTDEAPFPDSGTAWTVETTYSQLNEALASEDVARFFDSLPTGPPQALDVAKGYAVLGNFTDGYAPPTGLSINAEVITEARGDGARVWWPEQTVRLGIAAYDRYGRNIGVLPDTVTTVEIPAFDYLNLSDCAVAVRVSITAAVPLPAWVARLDVVRTDKATVTTFVEGVGRITYEYSGGGFFDTALSYYGVTPRDTRHPTGQYGIGLDGRPYNYLPAPRVGAWLNLASLPTRGRGYVWQKGDRVTLWYRDPRADDVALVRRDIALLEQRGDLVKLDVNPNDTWLLEFDTLLEDESNGPYVSTYNNAWVHVNADDGSGETAMSGASASVYGVVFRIYTPATTTNTAFWEVAAAFTPADFDGGTTPSLDLQGDTFLLALRGAPPITHRYIDANGAGSALPWIAGFDWAKIISGSDEPAYTDTVWRYVFNTAPTDALPEWHTDQGRPQALLPARLQRVRTLETAIRNSGKALTSTGINNLNVFDAAAEKLLPSEYGPIRALVTASDTQADGSVLLALCEREAVSLYVEAGVVQLAAGQTLGVSSEQVFPAVRVLTGGFGCRHPESISKRGGRVYWFSDGKEELVRYAQNGVVPLGITFRAKKQIRAYAQALRASGGRCVGGVDGEWNETLWSFHGAGENTTLAFAETLADGQPGFTTRYPWLPERYGALPYGLVSFVHGQPFRHGAGGAGQWAETAVAPTITFTDPGQPLVPTTWHSLALEARDQWVPITLDNERDQHSRCLPAWGTRGPAEVWRYALRRDDKGTGSLQLLNHGQVLRSLTLTVTLAIPTTLSITARGRLDAVTVGGQPDLHPMQQ